MKYMAHIDEIFVEGFDSGPNIDHEHGKDCYGYSKIGRELVDAEQHDRDEGPHQPRNGQAEHHQRLKKTLAHRDGAHINADRDAKKHRDQGTDENTAQALEHVKKEGAVTHEPKRFVKSVYRTWQQTWVDQIER